MQTLRRGLCSCLVLLFSLAACRESSTELATRRHAEVGKTPEGALLHWIERAIAAQSGDEADLVALGELTIPLRGVEAWWRRSSNGTFAERLTGKPYIFRSYAVGATPTNQYALPTPLALAIEKSESDPDGRGWRIRVRSGGADNARPVYLKQSEQSGLWYVNDWSNLYVDIRPPVDPAKEVYR
ncbi:MAG: hypothetical protein JNJ59_28225 [Deltaproteobacteria bacterium]|jgi:hypothetical protein|nr:hypothetical protein [Deltaproteobacteria bacterium]